MKKTRLVPMYVTVQEAGSAGWEACRGGRGNHLGIEELRLLQGRGDTQLSPERPLLISLPDLGGKREHSGKRETINVTKTRKYVAH